MAYVVPTARGAEVAAWAETSSAAVAAAWEDRAGNGTGRERKTGDVLWEDCTCVTVACHETQHGVGRGQLAGGGGRVGKGWGGISGTVRQVRYLRGSAVQMQVQAHTAATRSLNPCPLLPTFLARSLCS